MIRFADIMMIDMVKNSPTSKKIPLKMSEITLVAYVYVQ